jgi:hypothetical protein
MAAEDAAPAAAHAELLAAHRLNPQDPEIVQQIAAAG